MTSTSTNTCNRKIRSGRLGRKTNLAKKPNTKKKNEKKKTKKPCHRRTNRTYLYAGVP